MKLNIYSYFFSETKKENTFSETKKQNIAYYKCLFCNCVFKQENQVQLYNTQGKFFLFNLCKHLKFPHTKICSKRFTCSSLKDCIVLFSQKLKWNSIFEMVGNAVSLSDRWSSWNIRGGRLYLQCTHKKRIKWRNIARCTTDPGYWGHKGSL